MGYLLWSVERWQCHSERRWYVRLIAVYHSFNLEDGKSFFLTIKAKDVLEKQIEEAKLLWAQPRFMDSGGPQLLASG